MKITEPGIYDLASADYHADNFMAVPTLSNSIAKLLVNRTPRHAFTNHPRLNPTFEHTEDAKFDIGHATHNLILNDVRLFEVIPADDWRTKEAKAARDAARIAGKIPLLHHQFARVHAVVAEARAQLAAHEDAAGAFTNGKPEMSMVWEESGVWCRAKLDWLPNAGDVFDDYKSTAAAADPDAWQRIAFSLGFDMQAAFYSRGIRALGLSENPLFRFVVQEVADEPFALCVIALAPDAVALGDRKVDKALALWAQCLRENRWPGYPSRTAYIEAPVWHEKQYLENEARDYDRADGPGRLDPLRYANNWQAPLGRIAIK